MLIKYSLILLCNFLTQMTKINALKSTKGSVYWMAPEVFFFFSTSES
jgi:hypothetical protein